VLEAGSDSRSADRRGFADPRGFVAALGWQLATALFAPTPSSEGNSIGNAHHRPGRAKTRYHTRDTGDRARQSGGSSGPPKLDSTDLSVQCTLLQRTVATVLHDGSELQFRAVSFPGPTELRLLSLTGQETCPRARHDRIPAVFDDRLHALPPLSSAQVVLPPAAIATALVMPETAPGTELLVVVPLPSSP
jgi:hypothetical protein